MIFSSICINERSHADGHSRLGWLVFFVKQLTNLPIIRLSYRVKYHEQILKGGMEPFGFLILCSFSPF